MKNLLFSAMLWLVCTVCMLTPEIQTTDIVAMLVSLSFLSLCLYAGLSKTWPLCLAYQLACLFTLPLPLIAYLPVSTYLLALHAAQNPPGWKRRLLPITWVIALPALLPSLGPLVIQIVLGLLALLLSYCTHELESGPRRFYAFQDDAAETARALQQKNKLLQERQAYQVQLATLTERNRIAREIHDNVGHLLTRSLFQVSALEITAPEIKEPLSLVKATLTDAMNSIRASVHDLHDQSLDLPLETKRLIDAFPFCPVTLRCECNAADPAVSACFIAIIKESLSNIARHSNATQASISLLEHPALYQLIIEDNGTRRAPAAGGNRSQLSDAGSAGIGLRNMRDRVEALHGIFHLDQSHGYRLFISVPKDQGKNNKTY